MKKSILLTSVLTGSLILTPLSVIVENNNNIAKASSEVNSLKLNFNDIKLNQSDSDFYNKIIKVGKYFYFDENNILQIKLTEEELKNEYNFNLKEYNKLKNDIINQSFDKEKKEKAFRQEKIHMDSGKIYINNDELKVGIASGLVAAAEIGPAALGAALIALGTAVGGPVGTFLTTALSALGAPSLIALCALILYAIANDKGIYFGLSWSYPFLATGYW